MNTSVNIVIPMKDTSVAKRRLGGALAAGERAALAGRLFERTLAFFTARFPEQHVLVVTPSEPIAVAARRYGVTVLKEATASGLSAAARKAAAWGVRNGFESQLLIPADIARLDQAEIEHLLNLRRPSPSVILCPAVDKGTNALLTTPPDAIPFRFGPLSSLVHEAAALVRNTPCQIVRLVHLGQDIDTPDDLAALPPSLAAVTRMETAHE